jgi:hypothetical protein
VAVRVAQILFDIDLPDLNNATLPVLGYNWTYSDRIRRFIELEPINLKLIDKKNHL